MGPLRRVPLRQCLGCREKRPKKELIRIVRSPDNVVSLDPTSRRPGRGAYICLSRECLARAVKSKALERALRAPIAVEVLGQLTEQLERG